VAYQMAATAVTLYQTVNKNGTG